MGLAVHDLSEFFDSDAPGQIPSRQVPPPPSSWGQ